MLILYPLIWGPGRIGNAALLRAVKKAFGESHGVLCYADFSLLNTLEQDSEGTAFLRTHTAGLKGKMAEQGKNSPVWHP